MLPLFPAARARAAFDSHRRAFWLLAIALAALAAVWSINIAGADGGQRLFVSPGGSDSNNCSAGSPCKTISHAVSIASPGATVVAESGTYPEMVTLDKTIVLVGQNATIDASGLGNGVFIHGSAAAGSVVDGFTIENANFEGVLAMNTSAVRIANNNVTMNDRGAFVANPVGECAAVGHIPGDCGEAVHLWATSRSQVVNNHVANNVGGILLTDETGPTFGNLIAGNHVHDNVQDCGITLPSHNGAAMSDPSKAGVYGNTIMGNVSRGNGGAGVGMFAPFPGTASYNNKVIGNTLENNGEGGVMIHSHAPNQNVSGNIVVANNISGNGIDPDAGSTHPNGIAILSAVDHQTEVIAGNSISDEFFGIIINGPVTVHGINGNHFSSVNVPIQS